MKNYYNVFLNQHSLSSTTNKREINDQMNTLMEIGIQSRKLIWMLLILMTLGMNAAAATKTSTGSGNWGTSGTWSPSGVPANGDDVIIGSGHTVTINTNTANLSSLTVNSGGTLIIGGYSITVSGATTISGTVNINSTSGNKSFSGDVYLMSGSVWDESVSETITFGGNFTNNAATFTANTGTHTFNGDSKTISGTTETIIPRVSITSPGSITNDDTLTVNSSLSGNGILTNGISGELNIGGSCTVSTFDASNPGNKVNYTGSTQTVKAGTYSNITLSGSSTKSFGSGIIINGVLSMEGTATVIYSSTPTMGSASTLQYNKSASFSAGSEWLTTLPGNLVIAGTGAITAPSSTRTISGDFSINEGSDLSVKRNFTVQGSTNISGTVSWSSTSGSSRTITFNGDVALYAGASWNEPSSGNGSNNVFNFSHNFTNNATTFSGNGSGNHTFSGTSAVITGSTETSIKKVVISGTVSNSGILTITSDLSGNGTLTNNSSGILNIDGTATITNLNASATGNTVNYTGGSQSIKTTTGSVYHNLGLSGSGIKSFGGATTITNLSISSSAVAILGSSPANSTAVTLQLDGVSQVGGTWGSTASAATHTSSQWFGSSATATINITGGCVAGQWTGASSSDWATASNWCDGTIPTSSTDVTIPSGTLFSPVINSSAICNSITINSSSLLSINGTNQLIVSGNWSNIGNFIPGSSTVSFTGSATQSITGSTVFNNLTINNTSGVSITSEGITVNEILNLQSANASEKLGTLNTGSYTLNMGVNATTTGTGDVTGIVKRTNPGFVGNQAYSFGNQFTTLTFMNTGNKPGWVSCKITIGDVPGWVLTSSKPAVKRVYSFATDASGSGFDKVVTNLHYLDSELNGNSELKLVFWDHHSDNTVHEHGRSNNNTTDNWVGLAGLGITYLAPSTELDNKQWALGDYSTQKNTWLGISTVFSEAANWSAGHYPVSTEDVLIPVVGSGKYPIMDVDAQMKTLEIDPGASLTAGSHNVTITGYTGAWVNNGTFTSISGTVSFTDGGINASPSHVVTIEGANNAFYNLDVASNTYLEPSSGCYIKIAGAITTGSGAQMDFIANTNTVEFNGTDQSIINLVGPGSDRGYHDLKITGSGTKTLPSTLNIAGDFTNNGTVDAGTGTVVMKDAGHDQAIGGTSITSFYNLTIDNTGKLVTVNNDIDVANTLTVNTTLDMGTYQLSGVTSTSGAGLLKTQNSSGSPIPTGKTWTFGILFNSSSPQSISGGTYASLQVSTPTGTASGAISATSLTVDATSILGMNIYALSGITANSGSGKLKTQNTSTTPIPEGKIWFMDVEYKGAGQTVMNGTYPNLTLSGTGSKTLTGEITINGNFALSGAATASVTSGTITIAGDFTNNSSESFSASTGTIVMNGSTPQSISGTGAITFSDLTLNNAKGVIANRNITVNGILNLAENNPLPTRGTLELVSDWKSYPTTGNATVNAFISSTLFMGPNSSTTGVGDVSGIITRNYELIQNTPYTFGNQYTSITITPGIVPSAITVIVQLGYTPPGKPDAIQRNYQIIATGGSNCTMNANLHYKDEELQSSINPYFQNSEENLVTWDYDLDGGMATPDEHGRAAYDFSNNYIGFSNVPIDYFIYVSGTHAWHTIFTLGNFGSDYYTWNGVKSTSWLDPLNWSISAGGSGVPNRLSHVIIPEGTTYIPELPSGTSYINTISIENGAILSMGSSTLKIENELSGGWEDQNDFGNDPGTSTVVFARPGTTISGNSRFYNVEIAAIDAVVDTIADITIDPGSSMTISGSITRTGLGTGKWYANSAGTTVTYNGGSQTILCPDGIPNYNNLIIDGSGTKSLASVLTICNNMDIESGTSLEIGDNKRLTVDETLANNAGNSGLVIHSSQLGTGSLISNSSYIDATVERYIASDFKWHFLSSPVNDQDIWPAFAPTPSSLTWGVETYGWDFYYFNPNCPATGLYWVNLRKTDGIYNDGAVDESSDYAGYGDAVPGFDIAKGFLVAYDSPNSPLHSFGGSLNTGTISRSIVSSPSPFNLLGNPYPSSIDWNIAAGWDKTKIASNSYWIWNDAGTGTYGVYDGSVGTNGVSNTIDPMQGFFVMANSSGNFSVNNNARVHSSQVWLKNTKSESTLLRLSIKSTANTYSDEMIVKFDPESISSGSDKFWSFYTEAPEIYSVKDGKNYSIDRYNTLPDNMTVTIAAKTDISATYTITASNIADFKLRDKVYLLDLKTGIKTNLKQTPSYSFNGTPDDDRNRFQLIFGTSTGIDEETSSDITIYASENTIYVRNDNTTEPYTVLVSNMLGQFITKTRFSGNNINQINMNHVTGVYVVTVISNSATYSRKILLR